MQWVFVMNRQEGKKRCRIVKIHVRKVYFKLEGFSPTILVEI